MRLQSLFTGESMNKYLLAFDEINRLMPILLKKKSAEEIADDLLSYLIAAYRQGFSDVSEMLGFEAEINVDDMDYVIFRVIEGETFEDRVRKHVENEDLSGLQTLAASEYHRVYCQACEDAANQYEDTSGNSVNKTWNTMDDMLVRDEHVYLEGVTVGLKEEFYTSDGDHALCPGGFEHAENNVNCRCWLTYH